MAVFLASSPANLSPLTLSLFSSAQIPMHFMSGWFSYLPFPDTACSLSLIFHPHMIVKVFFETKIIFFPKEALMPDVKLIYCTFKFCYMSEGRHI